MRELNLNFEMLWAVLFQKQETAYNNGYTALWFLSIHIYKMSVKISQKINLRRKMN